MEKIPDDRILQRLVNGDTEALADLYDRYAAVVCGIARRILKDGNAAEDVVQTVFLQVWRQADRYDAARGTVVAWLCTLARTRALDALRKRSSRRENLRDVVHEATHVPTALDRLAVHQALDSLSASQRLTLELAYFEGLTQVEIAQQLGQPLGTVKTRARTALQRLRSLLETRAAGPRAHPPLRSDQHLMAPGLGS
jgi:RNA polymerase sigma-70 factor (ECF subfamily)